MDSNEEPTRAVTKSATTTHQAKDYHVVAGRTIWLVAGLIAAVLLLRVILFLFGAPNTGLASVIFTISGFFAAPFAAIFPTPSYGAFALDTASVVGIVVYVLAAWALGRLLMVRHATE